MLKKAAEKRVSSPESTGFDLSVRRVFSTAHLQQEYDINVVILIHYSGKFRERVSWLKRLGLLSGYNSKIHITLLASKGDGNFAAEILEGWDQRFEVTLLEMEEHRPVPKINGFYLWLSTAELDARWHLRVDDDSVTDISPLLNYADSKYGTAAVHLMNSPQGAELGRPIFRIFARTHGFNIPIIHEYEASLTSRAAFSVMFKCERAMWFITETGKTIAAPGDRALALAMQIAKVAVAPCPLMTKTFAKSNFSMGGGQFAHIHYVEWKLSLFSRMLEAFKNNKNHRPFSPLDAERLKGKTTEFGRCIGQKLGTLTFLPDGTITGYHHENETYWQSNEQVFTLLNSNMEATSQLETIITNGKDEWLVGPQTTTGRFHFIRLPRKVTKACKG